MVHSSAVEVGVCLGAETLLSSSEGAEPPTTLENKFKNHEVQPKLLKWRF
jgi:hypothetical protein